MAEIIIPPLRQPVREGALAHGSITGKYPAVWYVGVGCALTGGDPRGPMLGACAHAHADGIAFGLICIRPEWAEDETVQAHEYAHLLDAPIGRRDSHGPRFRKILADLGFPAEAESYVGWDKWERADAKARAAKA